MDSSLWAIALLVAALALLFLEILIPSSGLIFFAAMVCLVGSILAAWDAWWGSNPIYWWIYVASVCVLIPVSIGTAISVWPYTPIGRAAEPPSEEEVTPYLEEQRRLERLIGHVGEVVTPLNPAGIVRVEGQRLHACSEGLLIAAGEPIRVLSVQGNRVVVRKSDTPPPTESDGGGESSEGDAPLDFDFPSG
ncbi:MAG TPA: NfeD family protein [Planctomycetaceae bacterium]|nr:NfeD family protein [Planctomycetaceae bacterium]